MAEIAVLYPQQPSDGEGSGEVAAMTEGKRIAEALLFAATEPVEQKELEKRMP